ESIEHSFGMLRYSMKPLLITMIPLLLLITWLKGVYSVTTIASTWLWWYIGAGVISSITFRKIFKVV
ncbi:MAG: hypothetical protein AABX93_02205, partial [Nanoarchaeota archaeon]